MIAEIDTDGSGTVDFDEFMGSIILSLQKLKNTKTQCLSVNMACCLRFSTTIPYFNDTESKSKIHFLYALNMCRKRSPKCHFLLSLGRYLPGSTF